MVFSVSQKLCQLFIIGIISTVFITYPLNEVKAQAQSSVVYEDKNEDVSSVDPDEIEEEKLTEETCRSLENEKQRQDCLFSYCSNIKEDEKDLAGLTAEDTKANYSRQRIDCHMRRCNGIQDSKKRTACHYDYAAMKSADELTQNKEEKALNKAAFALAISAWIFNLIFSLISNFLAAQGKCSAASSLVMMASGLVSALGEVASFIQILVDTKKLIDEFNRGSFLFGLFKAKKAKQVERVGTIDPETGKATVSSSADVTSRAFRYYEKQAKMSLTNMRIRVAFSWTATALLWVAVGLNMAEMLAMATGVGANYICLADPKVSAVLSKIPIVGKQKFRSAGSTLGREFGRKRHRVGKTNSPNFKGYNPDALNRRPTSFTLQKTKPTQALESNQQEDKTGDNSAEGEKKEEQKEGEENNESALPNNPTSFFQKMISSLPQAHALVAQYIVMGASLVILASGALNPKGVIGEFLRVGGLVISIVAILMIIFAFIGQMQALAGGMNVSMMTKLYKVPWSRLVFSTIDAGIATAVASITTRQMVLVQGRYKKLRKIRRKFEFETSIKEADPVLQTDVERKPLFKRSSLWDNIREAFSPNLAVANSTQLGAPFYIEDPHDLRICVNRSKQADPTCQCKLQGNCFRLGGKIFLDSPSMASWPEVGRLTEIVNSLHNGSLSFMDLDPEEARSLAEGIEEKVQLMRQNLNSVLKKAGKKPLPTFAQVFSENAPALVDMMATPERMEQYKKMQKNWSAGGLFKTFQASVLGEDYHPSDALPEHEKEDDDSRKETGRRPQGLSSGGGIQSRKENDEKRKGSEQYDGHDINHRKDMSIWKIITRKHHQVLL